MKNPRPPGRSGPPQKPSASASSSASSAKAVAGGPPRKPSPSSTPTSTPAAASPVFPSQKPPPATTASPRKPPQLTKPKSRWESPSKSKPSPQANSENPASNSKGGGPSSASPSTIQRDQRSALAPAAAGPRIPPPFPSHPPPQFPIPEPATISFPPPPPPYGFQNLDRRTIVLVDGTVRTYFALPPEEPLHDQFGPDRHFPPPGPHLNQLDPEGFHEPLFGNRPPGPGYLPPFERPLSGKRKLMEEDELARQRMHVLQYGNPNINPNTMPSVERDRHFVLDDRDNPRGPKHARIGGDCYDDLHGNRNLQQDNVDMRAVKKAFLKFVKMIYDDADLKKRYLDTSRNAPPLNCIACGRASKDYPDVHGLVMHSYNFSQSPDVHVDHLGFHKALCILMGWNYERAPDNNKGYQRLSPEEAQVNREDLILWPPCVVIHNTNFGKRTGGRTEGFGNKEMDNILKDLGFPGGKARSIYNREGHSGVTIVQFAKSKSGLEEAEQLVNYFEMQNHDRKGWAHAQLTRSSGDDDRNPLLVKLDDRTGEKKRIFYGYMATISDIDEVDIDTKKRASLKSKREFDPSD